MRIIVLGSCSGTEPMPGRHHTSLLLEINGGLYWLDAGESCAYTAAMLGFDLPATRGIFISHPHLDHTGGLPHLLWSICKYQWVREIPRRIPAPVYTPSPKQAAGYCFALGETEFGDMASKTEIRSITDGTVIANADLEIEAFHNRHLGEPQGGEVWKSFSFLVKTGGKKFVYSGDVKNFSELTDHLGGCELLFMESGHHDPLEICETIRSLGDRGPHRLVFIHHGRRILDRPDFYRAACRDILGDRATIADDGTEIRL